MKTIINYDDLIKESSSIYEANMKVITLTDKGYKLHMKQDNIVLVI